RDRRAMGRRGRRAGRSGPRRREGGRRPQPAGRRRTAADRGTATGGGEGTRRRCRGRMARRHRAARPPCPAAAPGGVCRPGPDVLAVLTALIDARIGAVTSLEWIERNIAEPEARPGFINDHPEFAGCVVVSDPARFEAAVSRLGDTAPRTRTPVTVLTTQSATTANDPSSDRYVVLPHRATWDRDWAATIRVELDE